jgi:hypothetical protein
LWHPAQGPHLLAFSFRPADPLSHYAPSPSFILETEFHLAHPCTIRLIQRTMWGGPLADSSRSPLTIAPFLGSSETGVWTQGFLFTKQCFISWATPSVHFALVILVSWPACPGWPQTVILPISASQVARITGLNHQHPAM